MHADLDLKYNKLHKNYCEKKKLTPGKQLTPVKKEEK
jgi:hypothetical protein